MVDWYFNITFALLVLLTITSALEAKLGFPGRVGWRIGSRSLVVGLVVPSAGIGSFFWNGDWELTIAVIDAVVDRPVEHTEFGSMSWT